MIHDNRVNVKEESNVYLTIAEVENGIQILELPILKSNEGKEIRNTKAKLSS